MAIARYFAMTGAEIRGSDTLPPAIAWMACHFSPYAACLSNLPRSLPEGALLMVNDRTPIHGHDGERIAGQLREAVEAFGCAGVVLDFQRPGEPETAALAGTLVRDLPCPTAVSDMYAAGLACPVFLSPVPPDTRLSRHLAPWQGREIWLDVTLEGMDLTLTEAGASAAALPWGEVPSEGFRDSSLHCRYRAALGEAQARFSLWRTREDLEDLLREAEGQGVTQAIGLYQELSPLLR